MPMRYIGRSVSQQEYSVYQILEKKKTIRSKGVIDTEFLLGNYGRVAFPKDFYMVFKYLGGFVQGANSLIHNWADFILGANKEISLEKTYVLEKLLYDPEVSRDVALVREYFQNSPELSCVWSRKSISHQDLNIDHVLPFAHFLNNDIWNLLPSRSEVNNRKRDKIPSSYQLNISKDLIIHYWSDLHRNFPEKFSSETNIGLRSNIDFAHNNWHLPLFDALRTKAKFLIEIRGLEEWEW